MANKKNQLASKKNQRSGQTIIEFALVITVFVFMLSLTFNAILAFCTQQYLSYAVFMAARAYQAADSDEAAQAANAMATLRSYVPGLPNSAGGSLNIPLQLGTFRKALAVITDVNIPNHSPYGPAAGSANNTFGLTFKVPFVQVPIGGNLTQRFGTIKLSAQSFLGREVTKSECLSYFRTLLANFIVTDGTAGPASFTSAYWPNMDDNGC